jgi:hypothetical protein
MLLAGILCRLEKIFRKIAVAAETIMTVMGLASRKRVGWT